MDIVSCNNRNRYSFKISCFICIHVNRLCFGIKRQIQVIWSAFRNRHEEYSGAGETLNCFRHFHLLILILSNLPAHLFVWY